VAASLAAFAVVYFLVFGAGIWFLFRLFGQAPRPSEPGPPPGQPVRTAGTVSGIAPGLASGISAGAAPVQPMPAE